LTLARDAGGTLVEGLADEAYLAHEADEGQYRLIGLREGDFGFEIVSPDDDGAIRLAELILERPSPNPRFGSMEQSWDGRPARPSQAVVSISAGIAITARRRRSIRVHPIKGQVLSGAAEG
jgi:hypothetical protein